MEILCWTAPSVAENLALDVALARWAGARGRKMLRFWWGGPPAVVLGAGDRVEQAVDKVACDALGVPVLKRCTGGCAVLQTGGVLNYALAVPAPGHLDLESGFRLGTDLVGAILASLGVAGQRRGVSDVAVGDRKISGNAQARRWNALLVQGSLLVDLDPGLTGRLLRHPPREPEYRNGRSHGDFITSLRALGIRAGHGQIEEAAIACAHRQFTPRQAPPAAIRSGETRGQPAGSEIYLTS